MHSASGTEAPYYRRRVARRPGQTVVRSGLKARHPAGLPLACNGQVCAVSSAARIQYKATLRAGALQIFHRCRRRFFVDRVASRCGNLLSRRNDTNGSYDDGGWCAWGDANGDKFFTVFTGRGTDNVGQQVTHTITGGTAKFAGIQGKGSYQCKDVNPSQSLTACAQQFDYPLAQ
jgi:hypothetical protein